MVETGNWECRQALKPAPAAAPVTGNGDKNRAGIVCGGKDLFNEFAPTSFHFKISGLRQRL
jgi:hypothetical protein